MTYEVVRCRECRRHLLDVRVGECGSRDRDSCDVRGINVQAAAGLQTSPQSRSSLPRGVSFCRCRSKQRGQVQNTNDSHLPSRSDDVVRRRGQQIACTTVKFNADSRHLPSSTTTTWFDDEVNSSPALTSRSAPVHQSKFYYAIGGSNSCNNSNAHTVSTIAPTAHTCDRIVAVNIAVTKL